MDEQAVFWDILNEHEWINNVAQCSSNLPLKLRKIWTEQQEEEDTQNEMEFKVKWIE